MSEKTKREFIPFGLSPEYYKQRTVEKRIEVLEEKIKELESQGQVPVDNLNKNGA